MTTKYLLKTSGLTALAAALAVTVLPQAGFAQDNDRPGWSQKSNGDRGSSRSSQSSSRSEARSDRSAPAPRSESSGRSAEPRSRGGDAPRAQSSARNNSPPQSVPVAPSRVETRATQDARSPRAQSWTERGGRGGNERGSAGNDNRSNDGGRDRSYGADRPRGGNGRPDTPEVARPADNTGSGNWNGRDGDRGNSNTGRATSWTDRRDGERNGNRNDGRDNDGRDGNWNGRGDRDGDRDGNWGGRGDRDGDRNGSWNGRGGDRDGNWRDRDGRDGDRDGNRRWDRRWRDNDRYNWSHWRDRNRTTFHLGLYYAPYRNYSYSRIGIGFYLDSLFFSNRYWIADPWQYRLPEVYGPYRWVRYYDDVVLVDIYTGEVVDVIYDFFW